MNWMTGRSVQNFQCNHQRMGLSCAHLSTTILSNSQGDSTFCMFRCTRWHPKNRESKPWCTRRHMQMDQSGWSSDPETMDLTLRISKIFGPSTAGTSLHYAGIVVYEYFLFSASQNLSAHASVSRVPDRTRLFGNTSFSAGLRCCTTLWPMCYRWSERFDGATPNLYGLSHNINVMPFGSVTKSRRLALVGNGNWNGELVACICAVCHALPINSWWIFVVE